MKRKCDPPRLYVAEWIMALGYRQNEIATRAGVSESYITHLKKQDTEEARNPSFAVIHDIVMALGIPVDFILRQPPESDDIEAMRSLPRTVVHLLTRPDRLI
jgi:transcriptional regulator with XRE-family HTH domain